MSDYVKAIYEKLHAIPELAFEEKKTSEFISSELKAMGYDVIEGIGGTGIVGLMKGNEAGPTVAVRADMDALPFDVKGERVAIHACGHDANSSMVLAAAKQISKCGVKRGSIVFLFQPGEESGRGAKAMVDSNMLPHIDEMVGIHFRDESELTLGKATPALRHSGVAAAKFTITGVTCHGARPHQGINAVDVGVSAVNGINAIRIDPRNPHSAKVTKFNTEGIAFNIIPDKVELAVDIRTQGPEYLDEMVRKVEAAVKGACGQFGASYVMDIPIRLNAALYDEDMIKVAKEAIESVLGSSEDQLITTGSEDFHYFTESLDLKTTVIGLGANLTPGLHKIDMTFDKKALSHGEEILTKFINIKLNE